jgi:hypothetical protein
VIDGVYGVRLVASAADVGIKMFQCECSAVRSGPSRAMDWSSCSAFRRTRAAVAVLARAPPARRTPPATPPGSESDSLASVSLPLRRAAQSRPADGRPPPRGVSLSGVRLAPPPPPPPVATALAPSSWLMRVSSRRRSFGPSSSSELPMHCALQRRPVDTSLPRPPSFE